ncbi:immunoglobulin-like domain-containing receptor 2 isoform X2 [Syngnathoides biaculeatus]|uniref:immunoglobulin-like domain-containing receptor 2 isoform X2 n=1 Tax=Syngnathoides biaculeatus TaxID=300417 RepID=UPI002ADD4225|nr:immunoglobulin-like domain-containing receptor 2 isoform X2 [Syngnathoides biaculeatus]
MKRKRVARIIDLDEMELGQSVWSLFFIPKWWILVAFLAGLLPQQCCGVHVLVKDEKKYAVLFQSVVLPCQFNSVSTQTPIVQWVYKSYCRDRTRDSFRLSDSLSGGSGGAGPMGGSGHDVGKKASYLDCSDSGRTVRTVASVSGSSLTLSEYYKNRDVSIINKADLRIAEVQWGDSGVYTCKVVIADDVVGQNEASVELLVLGFSGAPGDLLPDFELKIMPEWVFVGAVALGSVLFLLLVGVCWCQCCPHSCCCYVSCCCCPDTCCCPKHLYEAGKGIKTGTSNLQTLAYPPYFVSGVPAMVPIAPPSLVEQMSSVPPSDGSLLTAIPIHALGAPYRLPSSQDQDSLRVLQYVENQLAHFNPARSNSHQSCGVSELSSLHEGETAFRPTFRKVQKKALPPIPDVDLQPEPRRYRDNCSPEPQRFRDDAPSSPQRYRQDPESEPRHCAEDSLPPRRYSDDPPPSSQSRRHIRDARQQNHSEENRHNRWNPRSEHLERKTYHTGGRTGSLDELEEFAATYKQRGRRRGENRDDEDDEPEHQEFSRYPSYRHGPPRHRYDDRNELRDGSDREDRPRRKKKHGHNISPLPSPKKGRGTWGNERSASPPPNVSPPSTSSQEKDYDGAFLNSLLERKAKLREVVQGKPGTRGEDDSDTPSKGSSKKSSGESGRHCSRSPSDRPEAHSPALYSDPERSRNGRPSPRPLPTRTRSPQPPAPASPLNRRGETRDKARKVGTLLSRDSLIV